ncbi:Ig-like domain-containing protein [Spongiimicrobium sp. 2-473A-2-J]|uniref:Ig-like domain-containing protein n=1 Tax=Eudoraea algarum TaxID=3417568 RepID=UPI003D36836F
MAPTVNISIAGFPSATPSEPIVVSGQIEINIDAKDAGGIAKIEAFINEQKVGEDTTAPYQIIVDISSFDSKVGSTNKFKDYILKVSATDDAGNVTSVQQTINIDNEMPMVSAVSLTEGTVINGDVNAVTFEVTDNEVLTSVKTFLNGELLSDVTDGSFEANINTLTLQDGENVFRIEATDAADNVGVFEVNFIADNTGPEVTLPNLEDGQILDELIVLAPQVSDTYSEIVSLEVVYGDTQLILIEDAVDYQLDFNPELFPTGTGSLHFIATDSLGNESETSISVDIYRRLITIHFPANYYNPVFARIYVFASSMDGETLDSKRVFQDTQEITLRTNVEIDADSEFMLTIGEYQTGAFGNASEFTTLQNLKPSTLGVLNLKTYPRFDAGPTQPLRFPATGFDPDDTLGIGSEGFGYGGSLFQEISELSLDRRRNTTSTINTDFIYLPLFNFDLNEYSYYVADWEFPSDFVLTPDLFTSAGVERRTFEPIVTTGAYESSNIWIAGYFNEDEFQNNVYHRIYGIGYGFNPAGGIPYYFNNIFDKYRYNVRLNSYYTERTGEPLTSFQTLDWTVDYSFANNEVDLIKSGNGHSVGKILIDSNSPVVIDGLNISYRWSLLFDSEKMDKIVLPKIPEEIQTWGFYQLYEQNSMEAQQAEIKRYDGITSYDEYLDKVIKNNEFSYLVSPVMESTFKSAVNGVYFKAPHFLLD